MPRLPNVDEAVYRCLKCQQVVKRTREDFQTARLKAMFRGRLPAYLLCGRCYSLHPAQPAPHMWRSDVRSEDREASLWGHYGSSTPDTAKGKQSGFSYIRDVSFAKCRRFVAYPVTEKVITNSGALLEAALGVVQEVKIAKGKLNAVAVHFSTSEAHAVEGQHYAVIDYAPNGTWADADTVKPGFYKTHRFTVIRQHQTKEGE